MALNAQYASTPRSAVAQLSAANTNRDGSGTVVTIISAGTNGTRVDDIVIEATATTTAGMVRLFLHNGTTAFLWKEVSVTAVTPSATASVFSSVLSNQSLILASGWSLRATTHNAEAFNVLVTRAGDF